MKEQPGPKDLRDRAYTLLDDVVAEIREAGQYAFRRAGGELDAPVPAAPEDRETS